MKSVTGSHKVKYHPDGEDGKEVEIDFSPPFRRIHMFPALEEILKVKLPAPDQLHTPEAKKTLADLCAKHGVECAPPQTAARLLDKVFKEIIAAILSGIIKHKNKSEFIGSCHEIHATYQKYANLLIQLGDSKFAHSILLCLDVY